MSGLKVIFVRQLNLPASSTSAVYPWTHTYAGSGKKNARALIGFSLSFRIRRGFALARELIERKLKIKNYKNVTRLIISCFFWIFYIVLVQNTSAWIKCTFMYLSVCIFEWLCAQLRKLEKNTSVYGSCRGYRDTKLIYCTRD